MPFKPDGGRATPVRAHFRVDSSAASRPAADSLPDFTEEATRAAIETRLPLQREGYQPGRADPMNVVRAVGPSMVGAGAAALVPGSAPVAGLLKLLAMFGGSSGTDAALRAVSGEPQDPGASLSRGGVDAAVFGVGQGINALRGGTSRMLTGQAMPVSDRALQEGIEQARAAGGNPSPGRVAAGIQQQARTERMMPGGTRLPSGFEAMGRRQRGLMDAKNELIQSATDAGITRTRQDFTSHVAAERSQVARGPNGTKNVERFDKLLDDFIAQGRVDPKKPLGKGNPMKRLTPNEWEADKKLWADYVANWSAGSNDKKTVADALNRALSRGMRERIEELTPGAVPGDPGAIASLNRQYRSNLPLEYALEDAEKIRGGAVRARPNPRAPLTITTSGPQRLGGHIGLALDNPALRGATEYGPTSLYALLNAILAARGEE